VNDVICVQMHDPLYKYSVANSVVLSDISHLSLVSIVHSDCSHPVVLSVSEQVVTDMRPLVNHVLFVLCQYLVSCVFGAAVRSVIY